MRNGAYAGPVTDGKHDVTVWSAPPPSSRSRASAGSAPLVERRVERIRTRAVGEENDDGHWTVKCVEAA